MSSTFDRRQILLASSALGVSALAGWPLAGMAQPGTTGDMEEVIVYPPGPVGTGTSIYNGAARLKLAKGAAFFGSGVASAGASIWGAIGVAAGGAAVVDPEPATKVILAALSGVIILEALAMGGMATLLAFIGADPPRSNYKVPVCGGAVTPVPETLKGFPAMNAYSSVLQTATTSARQFWDGIELWQGAQLAGDREWLDTHFKSCVSSYRALYDALQALPASTQAAFTEIESNKLGNFEIQDLIAPHAGKTLGSIPAFVDMLNKASVTTPCGDGVTQPTLDLVNAQKVPANMKKAMRDHVDDLKKVAKRFNKPI
jgi:hypothetical protein